MSDPDFLGLSPKFLTDGELFRAYEHYKDKTANAPGNASSYAYAKHLELIVKESERRGLDYHNPYPIVYGCRGQAHHDDQPEEES